MSRESVCFCFVFNSHLMQWSPHPPTPPTLQKGAGNHHHSWAKSTSANDYGISSIHHPAANLMSWQHQGTQRASIRAPHIQMCSAWAERYPTAVHEHSRNVSVNKNFYLCSSEHILLNSVEKAACEIGMNSAGKTNKKNNMFFLKANTQIKKKMHYIVIVHDIFSIVYCIVLIVYTPIINCLELVNFDNGEKNTEKQ